MKKPLPIHERYGVTVPVASEYVGISRSRIYELMAEGTLQNTRIGHRRIIIVSSLLRLMGAPATGQAA